MKITRALTAAALAGMLSLSASACSSSSGGQSAAPSATSTPRSTAMTATAGPAATSARPTATSGSEGAIPLRYKKIREPFSEPGDCKEDGSTQEMTACLLREVVDVDSIIDTLQSARFEQASKSERASILTEYARWLKGRTTSCAATATSGGSIDQIAEAQCLLEASQDRVETLNDVA